MTKIVKTVITVTVLHQAGSLEGMDLADIAYEIDEGDWLGQTEMREELVPDDRVRAECEELGNDGSFFEHLFDTAGDDTEEAP
jgi:hypothetical protein